jgi:hypothetical protein
MTNIVEFDVKKEADKVKLIYKQIVKYYNKKLYEEALFGINLLVANGITDEYLYQMAINIYFTYGQYNLALQVANDCTHYFPTTNNYYNKLKILKRLDDKQQIKKCLEEVVPYEKKEKIKPIIMEYFKIETDKYQCFNFINSIYELKYINEELFYEIFNHLIFSNYYYFTDLVSPIKNTLKKVFGEELINDSIIFRNLRKCSKYQFIHCIFLLIAPNLLNLSTKELYDDNLRITKNLDTLNYLSEINIKFETPDELLKYIPINFFYQNIFNTLNNKELFKKYSSLLRKICPSLEYKSENISIYNPEIIRIGFIGSNFMDNEYYHKDIFGLLNFLSQESNINLFLISPKNSYSGISKLHSPYCKHKRINISKNILEARKTIEKLKLTFLVYTDFTNDMFFYLLAHSKLAPVQINMNPELHTFGIKEIDYFISSVSGVSKYEYYTEKLMELKVPSHVLFSVSNLESYKKFTNYENKDYLLNYNIPKHNHKYGVLVDELKINTECIDMLKYLLLNDLKGQIIFILQNNNQELNNHFFNYIDNKFEELMSRVRIISCKNPDEYYEVISCMDIILDLYKLGSYDRLFDALYLNKIIITLLPIQNTKENISVYKYIPNNSPLSYITNRILYYIKAEETICLTLEDYINKAIHYASDLRERQKLENKIAFNKKSLIYGNNIIFESWRNLLNKLFNDFKFENPIITPEPELFEVLDYLKENEELVDELGNEKTNDDIRNDIFN